jgi:hypothetical protein
VSQSELLGFRTFSIVHYSKKYKTRRFGKWICFRPQVWGETPTTQLGPLDRASLNHWTWGRKQIQFPKRRVFYFLKYWTMEKVQKPSNYELLLCFPYMSWISYRGFGPWISDFIRLAGRCTFETSVLQLVQHYGSRPLILVGLRQFLELCKLLIAKLSRSFPTSVN